MAELPGNNELTLTESFGGDHDFQERVYGPTNSSAVPLRPATIPAYIVVEGQIIYTVEDHELPEEAVEYGNDGDWTYYTFFGHRFRVRKWLTAGEPNDV